MHNRNNSTRLVCQHCGNPEFAWTVEQVMFGDVAEVDCDDDNPPRFTDRYDDGPVVGINDDVLRCSGCDKDVGKHELVTEDEYEEDDQ